jgi:hypothetical protein
MARYLIEVEHKANKWACEQAVEAFLNSGSHFLTNADWGCMDGEHKAWLILNIGSKEEAKRIVPPAYRPFTKIIGLNKFEIDKVDEIKPLHNS